MPPLDPILLMIFAQLLHSMQLAIGLGQCPGNVLPDGQIRDAQTFRDLQWNLIIFYFNTVYCLNLYPLTASPVAGTQIASGPGQARTGAEQPNGLARW